MARMLLVYFVVLLVFGRVAAIPQNPIDGGAEKLRTAFLGIEEIASPEINQAPKGTIKELPPKKRAPLPLCIFFSLFAIPFGAAGLGMMVCQIMTLLKARAFLGEEGMEADATITRKNHYTTTSTDKDGHTETSHHYVVDYWFDDVRSDGTRCHVDVKNRHQPQSIWNSLAEGCQTRVSYMQHHPEKCRLTTTAQTESRVDCSFFTHIIFGLVFLAVGFYVGVVLPFQACGITRGVVCLCIWLPGVLCCIKWFLGRAGDGSSASVKELGQQKAAAALGDISGEWLLEYGAQKFVYKFEYDMKSGFVWIQGRHATEGAERVAPVSCGCRKRQESNSDWDAQLEGHWRTEEELIWQDHSGSIFVATFSGPANFEGVTKSCAQSVEKETMSFKGSRMK